MATFRKPDLNAPRYRRPVRGTFNQSMYQKLREQVPAAAQLSDKQLADVLLELNYLLAETVIDTRQGVELPESTGHVYIGSCQQPKKGIIDFKASTELGQRVEARNWNTDGLVAKIFYSNALSRYRFKHHELWGFDPCRKFTRLVGQTYPTQYERYVRVDPDQRTKSVFSESLTKLEVKATQQNALAAYDELSFD